MTMPTGRPILNVALDEETHAALAAFCEREGVTTSALVEAFARVVVLDGQRWVAALVADARRIAADRRRRNR